MSVVAVWARAGAVVMVADTRATGGPAVAEGRIWSGVRKVHRVRVGREVALVGAVGTSGTAGLTRHHAYPRPPRAATGDRLDRWVYDVAGSLREAAMRRGVTYRDSDSGEQAVDGSWLLAFRGAAWHLTESAGSRVEVTAIGTGGEAALGAIEVMRAAVDQTVTAQEVLVRAVEAACRLNSTCGLPVTVERL